MKMPGQAGQIAQRLNYIHSLERSRDALAKAPVPSGAFLISRLTLLTSEILPGRPILESELLSWEATQSIRNAAAAIHREPTRKFEISFVEKSEERLKKFSDHLSIANPGRITVDAGQCHAILIDRGL